MFSKKMGLLALAIVFVASTLLTLALMRDDTMTVSLYDGIQYTEVATKAKTVQQLLADNGWTVEEHDLLWPELDSAIEDGQRIWLKKAVPITIKIGNQTEQKLWTTADRVEGALREIGYVHNDRDIVTPSLHERVSEGGRIDITQVSYGFVRQSLDLKYDTVRIADDSLLKGTEKVVNEGEVGKEVHTYFATYYNGEMVDLHYLHSEVMEEPEEEVVHYGTLEPVTVGGFTFIPKKVLKNVILTSYSVQENISGKGPDHPQYGITRSGTKVKENHTIAVDPKVIPLGWWVYIDGYGLYRAEDTGGAIKGNKIDIYIEDLETVLAFGLKRNNTAYVIGPNKPKSN